MFTGNAIKQCYELLISFLPRLFLWYSTPKILAQYSLLPFPLVGGVLGCLVGQFFLIAPASVGFTESLVGIIFLRAIRMSAVVLAQVFFAQVNR